MDRSESFAWNILHLALDEEFLELLDARLSTKGPIQRGRFQIADSQFLGIEFHSAGRVDPPDFDTRTHDSQASGVSGTGKTVRNLTGKQPFSLDLCRAWMSDRQVQGVGEFTPRHLG